MPGVVHVLELMRLHERRLDGVGGTKAMIEAVAVLEALQLGLHHRPQVAWRVVAELNDAHGLAFEDDDHAAADLGGGNCHVNSSRLMTQTGTAAQFR
jgi:hypothetical protein